jgi:hypothetical protein
MAGASKIIAVDINPRKFDAAIQLGATDCVDSSALDKPVQQYIAGDLTPWGVDYSFDCTGHVEVMRAALECAHRGWVRFFELDFCTTKLSVFFGYSFCADSHLFCACFFFVSRPSNIGYKLCDWRSSSWS